MESDKLAKRGSVCNIIAMNYKGILSAAMSWLAKAILMCRKMEFKPCSVKRAELHLASKTRDIREKSAPCYVTKKCDDNNNALIYP